MVARQEIQENGVAEMMNAYVVTEKEHGEVLEVPIPILRDDEVLLEVKAAGLCGTDTHIYQGEYFSEFPLVPGHEFAGVIASAGKNVSRFEAGERVTADPNVACGYCSYCQESMENFCRNFQGVGVTRDGAFAQFVAVPQQCVFPIGDLPFDEAAFIEPLACVVYGQKRARPPIGASVLVVGAGAIGQLHIQLAKRNGAAAVAALDTDSEALKLASSLGADHCLENSPEGREELARRYPDGFSMVIDCTGIPEVVETLPAWVRPGGSLLVFGVCPENSRMTVNPFDIFRRDLTIIGSFALKKTFPEALALLQSGDIAVKPLVSRRLDLEAVPQTLAAYAAGDLKGKSLLIF